MQLFTAMCISFVFPVKRFPPADGTSASVYQMTANGDQLKAKKLQLKEMELSN